MDITLRPGDFPLGSVESRAAVRAMIERSEESRPRLRVVVMHPPHDCKGEICLQPSDADPAARMKTEPRICHLADKPLRCVNGETFYDVLM
jgi:hypothetical protein